MKCNVPRGFVKETDRMIRPLGKMYFEYIDEILEDELIISATNKHSPSKLFDSLMSRFKGEKK